MVQRSVVIVALIGGLVTLTGTFIKVVLPKLPSISSQSTIFRGRVSDNQGRPINNAKVTFEGKGLPPVIYTDSEGIFSIAIPPDVREITIRVDAPAYEAYSRRIDLTSKKELEDIRLRSEKAPREVGLSGQVTDENEQPLQGAKVSIDNISGMTPVETSSTGVFNLENLPLKLGDRVQLRVVLEGYHPNPYLADVVIGDYSPTPHLKKVK